MSYWLTGLVAIIQQANRTRVSKRISITTGNGDSSMPLLGSPPRDRALSSDGAAPEHGFAQPPRPLVPQLSVESEILVQGSLRAGGERSEVGERHSFPLLFVGCGRNSCRPCPEHRSGAESAVSVGHVVLPKVSSRTGLHVLRDKQPPTARPASRTSLPRRRLRAACLAVIRCRALHDVDSAA